MNRRTINFISGPLLQAINTIVYFAFRFIAEFGRGAKHPALHAVISSILFFAAYHCLCTMYREFQKPDSSSYETIASHLISLALADLLLWMEAWQTWPKADAPFVTLVPIPLLAQMVMTVIHAAIVIPVFRDRVIPENALLIAGADAAAFRDELLRRHGGSFHISEILKEDLPFADLCAKIDDSSTVILYEVSSSIREKIAGYCADTGKTLLFTPDRRDMAVLGASPVWHTDSALMKRDYGLEQDICQTVKRAADFVVSALLLILLSPFMLMIACAILAEDGAPVIYRQRRYTKGGRVFEILKFRTMRKQPEDGEVHPYTENDSRVTRTGKFLRRTHLDELPQLVNILKGDMSLIGPRPEQVELADLYTTELPEYPERLRVRAGLTGLAQVYGRYSIEPKDKLRADLMYIENQSFLLDLKILMLTAASIFRKEGTEGFDPERSEIIHDRAAAFAARDIDSVLTETGDICADTRTITDRPYSRLDQILSWLEASLQWVYFILLTVWCTYELLGRIRWTVGKETVRAINTFLFPVLQIGTWALLAVTAAVFAGTALADSRRQMPGSTENRRWNVFRPLFAIVSHPFFPSLCIFLSGILLIHTFSGITRTELLLVLILLGGFVTGRKTAMLLAVFFSAGTVFTILTWGLRLSEDYVVTFDYGVCHSIGFSNPNSLGLYIFLAFLFVWYLTEEKYRLRVFARGIVTAALCFFVSGCRTAAVLILFVTICSTWSMGPGLSIPEGTKRFLITAIPLLMLMVSVLTGVTLFPIDDKLSSTFIVRVVDSVYAFRDKGLSLYPQNFSDMERYYYFDTGYYYWIFRRGLLASTGLLLPILRLNYLVSKNKGKKEILLLICTGIYFCMEGVDILLLIPLLAFAGVFLRTGNYQTASRSAA